MLMVALYAVLLTVLIKDTLGMWNGSAESKLHGDSELDGVSRI